MTKPDDEYLQGFYAALDPQLPLDPDDKRRVALYQHSSLQATPTDDLRASIQWTPLESVHLFSGFRGTGKTTELRRLAADLREAGAVVLLADMNDYLNFEDVIDFSPFLLSIAGAISDSLISPDLLGKDLGEEGYWTRFRNFLTRTKVEINALDSTVDIMGAKLGIKAALKTDPSFRESLAKHMASDVSISAFVEDVHAFVQTCAKALRERHGDARIVFIFDSIEQIAVRDDNHQQMSANLTRIFSTYAKNLRFEGIHVVYTVPPWLKLANKGIVALHTGAFTLPCVKVRDRDGGEFEAGIALLAEVVAKREADWRRLFEHEAALRQLILASGGYIRDLFRLFRACLLRARRQFPLSDEAVALALADVTNSYMPLLHRDARWLHRVALSHEAEVSEPEDIPALAGYFDAHLVLCYANGKEWYDVHPLLKAHVEAVVVRLDQEAANTKP